MKTGLWACSLFLAAGMGACGLEWEPLHDEFITPQEVGSVEVAPLQEALTFARFERDGDLHVLAVTLYEGGDVEGVDLSVALGEPTMDPISMFNAYGFEGITEAIQRAVGRVTVAADSLVLPVELRSHHVAGGTNFPEHAAEAGVSEGPYLFPSLKAPTGPYANVPINKGLLDYEVELAWVTLDPVEEGTHPEHMGLLVCNDYTNREALLRHLDPNDVASGKGFPTGKSFPGYLPVGNLFVIPLDYRSFGESIELELYLDRYLRQRAQVSRAVWGIEELLDETWARSGVTWEHRGERYPLYDNTTIKDRTLVMSGTPPGVIFNEVGAEPRASAFLDFVLGGWGETLPDHAIDDYIRDARAAGIYLMPGDEVLIRVDFLGVVRNEVVE
ncbi:MAG: fumarylacetoacetate hydrolase family protein [Nannocystales bacterium]